MGDEQRRVREVERELLRRQWRLDGWYPDLTVGEALEAGARRHPDDRIVHPPHIGFDRATQGRAAQP